MIEIAIALGVIGFALVAIIGILPLGLNVQKDNRKMIAAQDGQYFMDVLRYAGRVKPRIAMVQRLDFLTNYVESIPIRSYCGSNLVFNTLVSNMTFSTGPGQSLTNGHVIVGMLNTRNISLLQLDPSVTTLSLRYVR